MNDYTILAIVGFICILIAYVVRVYNNVVLKNSLKKQCDEIQTAIARAYKLFKRVESEPQELLEEGLAGAGLGPLLENLNLDSLKALIPAKYHIFLPVVQGFLDGIKKKGVGNVSPENTFKGQGEP